MLSKGHFDCAKDFLDRNSVLARWTQSPRQGRTLRVTDATGSAMELCFTMDAAPRLMQAFEKHQSGCPQRLDPVLTSKDGTDDRRSVWLQREGTPHEVVFSDGGGPHLQYYTVPEVRDPIDACDVVASLGDAARLERGPDWHGIGNAFVYLQDTDSRRIEVFNTDQRCTC